MKRVIGIVIVAFVILGLVPYPLRATTGPIFWVQANQGYSGGSTWNDLAGFGRHMQLYGSWYHENFDYLGGAYGGVYFDTGAYAQSPLITSAYHTVSMEVIFYTIDNTLSTQMVFYNGSELSSNGYGVALIANGSQSEIQVRYGGMGSFSTGVFINPETWYHTVVTIGSNGDIRVYVNGTLRHTRNFILPNTPSTHTRIGNTDVSSEHGLWGGVSVARMYDRELTGSEVLRLSQGNLATSTLTATQTFTPSNTPTRTFTPSNTATQTPTLTSTPTATATSTPTTTPTVTDTPSNTPTATDTPSNTPTVTDTPSKTPSPTLLIAQKTATAVIARTQTAVTGRTRTAVAARTQTASVRTRTAMAGRTQTAVARTRTAMAQRTQTAVMAKTRTAIMAKTNTVIAKTRTSTRTRTATMRRVLVATMTPTVAVAR